MAPRPRAAGSVPGASASSRSWSIVLPSSSLRSGARRWTGIALSIARLSVGSAPRSSAVAGAKSWPKPSRLARNGRCARKDSTATSIVPGLLEIVSLSAPSSRPSASNVSAIEVNSSAPCLETGDTTRAVSASSVMKVSRSVSGSERLVITGCRCSSRSGSSSIVRPSETPRPANASPNPRRFSWLASRVGSSNIFRTSSMSVDALAWPAGTVSPFSNALSLRPSWSSRYFRPSAERGRMRNVESSGTSPIRLSSLSISSASTLPSRVSTGFMSSTTPMREPPERISLPGTRLAPFGHADLQLRRGDERQPLVGVVGQEDRDDHDQHGHAADEDGVGRHS